MAEIVECVPNFSEGRRKEVVDEIAKSIASVSGVRVLDAEMDPDHNRSVITFIGDRAGVAEAAFQGARTAVARIWTSSRSCRSSGSRWTIASP